MNELSVPYKPSETMVVRTYQDFATLSVSTDRFSGLVKSIQQKIQNHDTDFYNVMVSHYISMKAAMLHVGVKSNTRGRLPVGNYSICLADSGFGKGFAQTILEKQVFHKFFTEFSTVCLDASFEQHVAADAYNISRATGLDPANIEERLRREYGDTGPYTMTFDSGTAAAMKQLRHKLMAAHLGSVNFLQDEVGLKLANSLEELTVLLELYDTGSIKEKLIKNTKDNQRYVQKFGITPATMLLFGTPKLVFDGGRTENAFVDILTTGFARRSLFAWGLSTAKDAELSAQSINMMYSKLVAASDQEMWDKISDDILEFAKLEYHRKTIMLNEPEEKILLNYKLACEQEAKNMNEFADLLRTELIHRHSKVLKLAGALAFFEKHDTITERTLLAAISIVERSGKAFEKVVNRERTYATLARFLAAQKQPVTLADMSEALPFFKTAWSARKEQLELAAAWGRNRFITIKEERVDGISMYQGFALEQTDLSKLVISASINQATGFEPLTCDWNQDKIAKLLTLSNHDLSGVTDTEKSAVSWCPITFKDNHRKTENVIPGTSMIVLDVDGTTTLESVHDIFRGYHFATCTTKSHTDDSHRFRVVVPINVCLTLDENDYRTFMQNIIDWLPFQCDRMSCAIAHKWLTNPNGEVFINKGEDIKLFDAFPFIPGTRHNELRLEEMKEGKKDIRQESQLIYWFIKQINEYGNRNTHLFRLGVMLAERTELPLSEIYKILMGVNSQIKNPLGSDEVLQIANGLKSRHKKFALLREKKKALQDQIDEPGESEVEPEPAEDIPYGTD